MSGNTDPSMISQCKAHTFFKNFEINATNRGECKCKAGFYIDLNDDKELILILLCTFCAFLRYMLVNSCEVQSFLKWLMS